MPGNMENVGGLKAEAEIDTSKFEAGSKKLEDSLNKLDPAMKRTEQGMKNVEGAGKKAGGSAEGMGLSFKKLFPAITAANVASAAIVTTLRGLKDAFVGSVKGAIDFQAQLVQVRKVTGATKTEMADLKKFIMDMAVQTGIAKAELADIAAGGGRLGIFDREGLDGLKEFTRVQALGRVAMEDFAGSSEEAADKTARLLNLFGLTSRESEVLLSIINQLSNTAAATSSNIADNVTSFASLSQTFDASKESLLALATTMEEVGAEPQAFSTALQTALIQMQGDVDKFARFLGPTVGPQFKKAFAEEPIEAFAIFLRGLNEAGRDVGKVLEGLGIGDARLIRELSKLATDKGLERFADNLKTAQGAANDAQGAVEGLTGATSSLQQEFDRAGDTTQRRLKSLSEATDNAAITFGEGLRPAIDGVSDSMASWIEWATPAMGELGEMVGEVTVLAHGLMAEFGGALGRGRNTLAGIIRAPFEWLGLAEKGAAKRLIWDDGLGDMSTPGADIIQQFEQRRRQIEERVKTLAAGADRPGSGGGGGGIDTGGLGGGGGGGAKETKEMAREIEKIENAITAALKEQAQENKERVDRLRDELLLKQRLGVLTKDEEKMLEKINRRVAFGDDKVQDLTRKWEKANDTVEKHKDLLDDINDQIKENADDLKKSLDDIDRDLDRRRADIKRDAGRKKEEAVADLIKEKQKLEGQLARGEGLNVEEQKRLASLEELLRTMDPALLQSGKDLAGLNELQLIDRESQQQLEDAEQEAKLRKIEATREANAELDGLLQQLAQTTIDLAAAEKSRDDLQKQLITTTESLSARTEASFTAMTASITLNVNEQVKQLAMLKAAYESISTPAISNLTPGFAHGGPIVGPGGPTDDQVLLRASPGEAVVNAKGYSANRGIVDAINAGIRFDLPRFAQGGPVTHDNSKTITISPHYHGQAAGPMSNPHMLMWLARRAL